MSRHPLWELLDGMQQDHRDLGAKLVALRAFVAQMELPSGRLSECPHCGPIPGGPRTLAEHLYVSHSGPVPEHWQAIEAASEESG